MSFNLNRVVFIMNMTVDQMKQNQGNNLSTIPDGGEDAIQQPEKLLEGLYSEANTAIESAFQDAEAPDFAKSQIMQFMKNAQTVGHALPDRRLLKQMLFVLNYYMNLVHPEKEHTQEHIDSLSPFWQMIYEVSQSGGITTSEDFTGFLMGGIDSSTLSPKDRQQHQLLLALSTSFTNMITFS